MNFDGDQMSFIISSPGERGTLFEIRLKTLNRLDDRLTAKHIRGLGHKDQGADYLTIACSFA